MPAKPKPVKGEKTFEDKLRAAYWCKRHNCPKYQCHPHRPSRAKPRKPIMSKKPIRVKPKAERRKFSQSERTLLEKELDTLCSKYVRLRDRACVTCGSRTNLTCSHFIKRSNQYIRYDVDVNLNCQCLPCNQMHNTDESAYEIYLLRKHGRQVVSTIRAKNQITYFRWSVVELREMVEDMKQRLEALETTHT